MKEFLTFKSGKFYFNHEYDATQVESLLVRATVLNETIVNLPILPELASRLEPEIMYSSIAGTAAIEGNPCTREDVEKIAQGEEVAVYTKKDQQEIRNLITAYNFLASIEPSSEPFLVTEEIICKLHKMITNDVADENNRPGKYRNGIVYVGDKAHGGVYTPPKILEDIKNLMREYTGWINSEAVLQTNPFIRASLAHYYFATIHPFWDGNGRTARLLEALILQSVHIKYAPRELSNYYYRNVDEYYIAFSKSIKLKKDPSPFLTFSLKASVDSLERIKETILAFITKCTLKDFYRSEKQNKRLTARQFELMDILLDHPVSFSLKDLQERKPFSILYRGVTTQTARRDIKRLLAQNLLIPDGEKKYVLNFRVLG
ncbi:MAG: Fic family protein [Candidatus Electrothrix sp. GW3-4]|uniref:Fic family protein n=1 Tax=Candidatus Electrothrix sp. GW3-4 TaxID=3126740 RepID=UPI0030CB6ECD